MPPCYPLKVCQVRPFPWEDFRHTEDIPVPDQQLQDPPSQVQQQAELLRQSRKADLQRNPIRFPGLSPVRHLLSGECRYKQAQHLLVRVPLHRYTAALRRIREADCTAARRRAVPERERC